MAAKIFVVKPNNGDPEFEVKADKALFDAPSGRTTFHLGDEVVGSLINVNWHVKQPS